MNNTHKDQVTDCLVEIDKKLNLLNHETFTNENNIDFNLLKK